MSVAAVVVESGRARPLRWWTATEREAAARRLLPVLEAWTRAWGLQLDGVSAGLASRAPDGPCSDEPAHLPGRAAQLWSGDGSITEVLHLLMFDEPSAVSARQGVAHDLAGHARQSLLHDLAAALPATSAPDRPPAPPPTLHRWCGALQFDITLVNAGRRLVVCLLLDPSLSESWCAGLPARRVPPAPDRQPLQSIGQALAALPARVSVELTPVELELRALHALRSGDVIALRHRIDQPLHVLLQTQPGQLGRAICRGHLAMHAGRRVVQLSDNPETP